MLSIKQGGIMYYFQRLWYDETWDLTHISRTIGKHTKKLRKIEIDNNISLNVVNT